MQDELVDAICRGDLAAVKNMIDAGANVRYQDANGYDAVINSAYTLRRDPQLIPTLQLLIDSGVSVSGQTKHSESGLSVLSRFGRFDGVRLLLNAGGNPAYLEFTPLMEAIAFGTADDVSTVLQSRPDLEERDWWERTAWIIAIQTGNLTKAKLLLEAGAQINAQGRCGWPPLFYAQGDLPLMVNRLLGIGIDVGQTDAYGETALEQAAEYDDDESVKLLLQSGIDVNQKSKHGSPLGNAESRDVTLLLLDAGADPQDLSNKGRRAILRLSPDFDESLLTASVDDYLKSRTRRFGSQNPEPMTNPFWKGMIRSGLTAYGADSLYNNHINWDTGYEATWCAQRFGQSLTILPDDRIVQVAGEHEDGYDPDFCIYNDVFVHKPNGEITIYGYPVAVFPPTDFHTATLIGSYIYLIGSVGYQGEREYGVTPVYRLDTRTLAIEPLATTGENPGWISRHRDQLAGANNIEITGGKVMVAANGRDNYLTNGASLNWS